jgi:hypothetical protein
MGEGTAAGRGHGKHPIERLAMSAESEWTAEFRRLENGLRRARFPALSPQGRP